MLKQITVITPNGKTILNAPKGTILADALSQGGFSAPAACGRKGTCGKCAVKLISGTVGSEIPRNGMIRSCKATVEDNAVIEINFRSSEGLTQFSKNAETKKGFCGIAVDIGTTTVAASLLKKDSTIVSRSCLNPQSVYGADVISRIETCANGALDELTRLIRQCVRRLISELNTENEAEELIVSGNTTMLHIFCGISPEGMGVSPFTPKFTDVLRIDGMDFGIKKVTVLPSASAFIGSDIVAGIYSLGLHETNKRILLADLGTNGELVLSDRGKLYCASTAAGPAFEGACIECGVGGISGAIDRVFAEDGEIGYTTIGGAKPAGICGAGLIDAIALLLSEKRINESGYLENKLRLCENVYISQNDIRQFQLAKSAIFSGIETLIESVGISHNEIDCLLIAGGLGYYINPKSAVSSGIFPQFKNVKAVGNTSLQGALMCIGNGNAVNEMSSVSKACTIVDLGGNPKFSEKFIKNMFF